MFTIRLHQLLACRAANKNLFYGIGVGNNGLRGTGDCGKGDSRGKGDSGNGDCENGGSHSGGDSKTDKPPRHLCPDCNPSAPTIYDCRKYGHNLPCDSVMPYFETLPYFPTGIFRSTAGEVLGLGANKGGCYKNPEYFSFHHMSYYDMHMLLRCYRNPSAKSNRKK